MIIFNGANKIVEAVTIFYTIFVSLKLSATCGMLCKFYIGIVYMADHTCLTSCVDLFLLLKFLVMYCLQFSVLM
jgi:hypothetical protein